MNTYYEKLLLLYPAYLGYMGYRDEFIFLIMAYIVYNLLLDSILVSNPCNKAISKILIINIFFSNWIYFYLALHNSHNEKYFKQYY